MKKMGMKTATSEIVIETMEAAGADALLAQLERQFLAGGHQRRQAMELCRAWRHPAALPLIRRGLRDADTGVVAVAAEAMTVFRGRTSTGRSGLCSRSRKPIRGLGLAAAAEVAAGAGVAVLLLISRPDARGSPSGHRRDLGPL